MRKAISDLKIDLSNTVAREKNLAEYIATQNFACVPISGYFRYDFAKDLAIEDVNSTMIYGFDNSLVQFADVLKIVDPKSKTLFEEQSVGNVSRVNKFETDEFLLGNGNIVKESYKFEYHSEDYEMRSPTHILGKTTLLRKVA